LVIMKVCQSRNQGVKSIFVSNCALTFHGPVIDVMDSFTS
jgi:hypothetical protein